MFAEVFSTKFLTVQVQYLCNQPGIHGIILSHFNTILFAMEAGSEKENLQAQISKARRYQVKNASESRAKSKVHPCSIPFTAKAMHKSKGPSNTAVKRNAKL